MAETTDNPAEILNGQPDQGSGDFSDQTSKLEDAVRKYKDLESSVGPEKQENGQQPTETTDSIQEPLKSENTTEANEQETETQDSQTTQMADTTQELTEPEHTQEHKKEQQETEDQTKQVTMETTEPPGEEKVEEKAEEDKAPEFEDILGSGALLKKVIKKGTGKKPRMGERVTIEWTREIPAQGKNFPKEDLTFIAGDGDVVQALDLLVVLINEGDVVEVQASHRFMYGEIGLPPDVPPQADFQFSMEIVANSGVVDYDKMDFDARFCEAKAKKERGNFLFKRKEYSLALTSYRTASKIVDPDMGCVYPDQSPEKLQELLEFRAVILCNTSVSQLRCDAFDAAVKSALEAIKLSPSYSKAYFRLGQAYEKKALIDETIKAYKTALKYDPENSKVLHGELARLTKVNRKAKESEQKMYSKMFWGDKPPAVTKDKTKDGSSGSSWAWKFAVVGAGIVGLASIVYKYMNH